MARYKMEDGRILDTEKAAATWEGRTYFNGNNHIGISSGSQWDDQTLHRSSKGQYWLEEKSRRSGTPDFAEYMTRKEAATWLLENEIELPDDLAELEADIAE